MKIFLFLYTGVVRYKVNDGTCTYNQSFDEIRSYIKGADFSLVNLESMFSDKKNVLQEKPHFKKYVVTISEKAAVPALRYCNIGLAARN